MKLRETTIHTTAKLVLSFFIYAVMGWLWETVYCSAKAGHFVFRGVLYGPYCPIYGFGVILVLYFIMPLKRSIVELFIFSVITVTVLEYTTAYMLEIIFRTTFWNYETFPLNIQGRVAIPISIFWGLCCLLIVKFIQPSVTNAVDWLHTRCGLWLAAFIFVVLIMDAAISTNRRLTFRDNVAGMPVIVSHSGETLENKGAKPLAACGEALDKIRREETEKLPVQ